MFERIRRGFALTGASLRVLWLDKEILLLPVMSGVVLLLVLGVMLGGGAYTLVAFEDQVSVPEEWVEPLMYAGLFLFYLVSYTIIVFFNAAVVECASIRFDGGDPVVRDGLRKAWQRKGRIVQWAALAATVGVVLQALRDRARGVGDLLLGGVGIAWGVATYFVVPVLVHEDMGPVDAVRRSAETLKRAWGEALTGGLGTGFVFGLAIIAWIFIAFAGLGGLLVGGAAPFWVLPVVLIAPILLLVAAKAAVDGILLAGLYRYAETGVVPSGFEEASAKLPPPSAPPAP